MFTAILLLLAALATRSPSQSNPAAPAMSSDLARAEAALKANDKDRAATLFRDVLRRDPENAEAHANLGAIAFSRGDCDAAEPDLRAALKQSPGLAKVEALLSVCERRRGEPSATADMEAAFAGLDDPRLRLQLGMELANLYYGRGELEKTAAILGHLRITDPDNVDVLFFAQRIYSALADNALTKLAVLSPDSARMEQLIAERLINGGDLKDAEQHYRKAIELSPTLPGLHFELAETLLEASPNSSDAQSEALRELEAAKQIEGDSAKVEGQLGRIASSQAKPAEAMEHFARAAALDPSDAQAQMGLAELYIEQQRYTEAASHLKLVIDADPLDAAAHYKLSQVDRNLHEMEQCKQELKLFMQIRAAQDKVKLLYRQMSPQTTGAPAGALSVPR